MAALGLTRKEQWALMGTIVLIVAAICVQGWRERSRSDLVYVQGQGYWRRLAVIDAAQDGPKPSSRPVVATAPRDPPQPASKHPAAIAAPEAKLDLNAASQEQLERLPGIGPAKAAAILAARARLGRFASVDQLTEAKGIGSATLERLRPYVRVVATSGGAKSPNPGPASTSTPGSAHATGMRAPRVD